MTIYEKLWQIQRQLKAPKNQYNSFGKYNYRSCEDILEGLKHLLTETKAVLTIEDEPLMIGDRYYIKAVVTLIDTETGDKVTTSALAREDETKKGMDLAQVTGSTSSYARKYALNGLFAIDDTKDSDATNGYAKEPQKPKQNTKAEPKQESFAMCSECKKDITEAEKNWGLKKFGKCLCRDCQKKAKKAV